MTTRQSNKNTIIALRKLQIGGCKTDSHYAYDENKIQYPYCNCCSDCPISPFASIVGCLHGFLEFTLRPITINLCRPDYCHNSEWQAAK